MAETSNMEASQSSLNSLAASSTVNDTQQSKPPSANTSLSTTPLPSRDSSPSRTAATTKKARSRGGSVGTRSRKNSTQDLSPSRTRSNLPTPSGGNTPRTISASSTPTLPPPSGSEPVLRAPVPQKPSLASETSREGHRWPVSPRLKSPPPSLNKPALPPPPRPNNEREPPVISVQRATPSPNPEASSQSADTTDSEDGHLQPGMRTPVRGTSGGSSTLETVEEVSPANTPGPALDSVIKKLTDGSVTEEPESTSQAESTVSKTIKSAQGAHSESGSESGSVKASTRRSSSVAPPPSLSSRHSSTALRYGAKAKPTADGSAKHMTVETETVTSMPQVALVPGVGGSSVNGSLRTKPSSETIRPKKEKKKTSRKQPTVSTGNASSKADIFEAKIASAVEEANSSDSEETFVYDSNPPDVNDRPRRYHSRTPSATSMVSQIDRTGIRSIHGVLEGAGPAPAVKKSMKFTNTYNSNGTDSGYGDDDGKGTGRSNAGSARGTARHHHHIGGRWNRNNGNTHTSLFDNESPFPNAAKTKLASNTSRTSSNPTSPRFPPNRPANPNGKRGLHIASGYDLDDTTTGADDERTPLLTSNLSPRSNRSSRRTRGFRRLEDQIHHGPSILNRFASCLVLTVMLILVITGAIGFMFATSQPLLDVELVKIGNVLASEQELMLDIHVKAHNPNVVVIMIDAADLEIFAKSPHAGSDSEWWKHPHGDSGTFKARRKRGGLQTMDDPPDDQIPPDEDSAPNMRLGSILELDSPLTYEGAFFHQGISSSIGSLRLAHPGNSTTSGSERWERIMSDEFDLIVKGVLKYNLPLSQRTRSVAITGRTTVKPNQANDPSLQPNRTNTDFGISW